MNIQHMLLGIIAAVLLVASSYGASLNENETNATTDSNFTNPVTTLITTINTQTTAFLTTARATTDQEIITTASAIVSTGTNPTPIVTTAATATSSTASTASTSAPTKSPTTKASGRKFDGLSFIGGMILASGLGGLIFLVVSYLRRTNRLPYSNLR